MIKSSNTSSAARLIAALLAVNPKNVTTPLKDLIELQRFHHDISTCEDERMILKDQIRDLTAVFNFFEIRRKFR